MIWTLQYMNFTDEDCFLLASLLLTVHRRSAPRPVIQQSQNIVSMVEILMVCVIVECAVASLEHVLLCWYCDVYRVNNECSCTCCCCCSVLLREISLVAGWTIVRSGWFSTLRSPLICNFGRLLRFSTSNGYQCRYVSGVFSRVSASVWWCCAGVVVVTLLSLGVLLVHCFNLQRWFRRIVVYMNFLDSSPNCDMLDSASSWFAGISGIIMGIICVCATADSYETIGRKLYNFSLSS